MNWWCMRTSQGIPAAERLTFPKVYHTNQKCISILFRNIANTGRWSSTELWVCVFTALIKRGHALSMNCNVLNSTIAVVHLTSKK